VSLSAGILPGQDFGELTVLTIGDRCVIGRGSHIVAHQSVAIGDDVWTGPYVYITDQNHGYEDPDTPIGNQFPVNRPVSIGQGSWLGAGAIILPGARIGRNVVVAAGAVVRGDVPDRCVVAGVPARIVREHTESGWQRSQAAGHGLNVRLAGPSPQHPLALNTKAGQGRAERGDGTVKPRQPVGQCRGDRLPVGSCFGSSCFGSQHP
jgi:carbonic anhydrase/acetyltransferase-like protein (isoleucine patch superfamily)